MAANRPTTADAAAFLGLPWWDGPVPFTGLQHGANHSRKALINEDQGRDLAQGMKKFCKSGGKSRPSEREYLTHGQLTLMLNLYNARTHTVVREPWAYFHHQVINIPHKPPNGFNWHRAQLTMPTQNTSGDNFVRDLTREWPTITEPEGTKRGHRSSLHYRLLCFIHEHFDPDIPEDFYEKVYTMSVYDRETGELAWHDPSAHHRASRLENINRFWRNVVHDFPIQFPKEVVHVPYMGLQRLGGCLHWTLDPVFSQKSILGIGLWLMNNILEIPTNPPVGLRPPDAIHIASAAHNTLLPSLLECIWLTLRENPVGGRNYQGTGYDVHQQVMKDFGMDRERNPWLRTIMRIRMQALYPNEAHNEWIIRAFSNRPR